MPIYEKTGKVKEIRIKEYDLISITVKSGQYPEDPLEIVIKFNVEE